MAASAGTKKLEAVFSALPPEQRAIADALRRAIRAEGPTLVEDVKWNSPAWGGQKLVFCLMIFDSHLNLGFFRGAELAKRHPSIEGTGKSLRHIKIRGAADAKLVSVRAAIRDAIKLDASG
ncbi:MAG: DUF1801 domain-containing protein [Thermoplasmata archaeon]|nr:DUF1801 domain-containing protein [Thermoplasmata archaeon]MCI4332270.1 DUF1801 domain-containing protein [Thermoplasmata archaeon]